ncbi:diacylglycerol/lipid kinase family protein [Kineococcus rhizosphaerae]|uniref:Diacylglycerol kinase family enzyme n=1 Tax=Kineococcus rhizosphaerae TaxID=559628 RepID=A0A2T0R2H8_9ACTN|nr:diacylglycerol kinase family protein [Kineococcus rhizosphaerae]PRY13975.1 diacylglycerol kinase family enzyme [Kineococcus rhizosphaerae]
MSELSRVVVVLNPNSTGDGPSNARGLRDELDGVVDVELVETQHAGHAEDLARDAVRQDPGTLVVSASGDGGYHEVVNGVFDAGRGMAAVLPSGNANDHATAVQERPLGEAIRAVVGGEPVTRMDLLEVSGAGRRRVAHSYAGVGITPVAAAALNEHDLDAVKEAQLVVRAFWRYRPLTITHDGNDISIDSLVFANIDRMAKYAQLAEGSAPDDGRYETLLIPHRSKLRLVLDFTRVLRGAHPVRSRSEPYEFTTHTPMPLQLDGEVFHVDAGSSVTVRCLPRALRTVL